MDREQLIAHWKKQVERCEKAIESHTKNGFYDLAKEAEGFKREAEEELKKLFGSI